MHKREIGLPQRGKFTQNKLGTAYTWGVNEKSWPLYNITFHSHFWQAFSTPKHQEK
jgi:hypothetical protein